MRIAVADDNLSDRERLAGLLGTGILEKGFSVDCLNLFESGESLLCGFEGGKYDLIFLDMYMGGINGIETARKIRGQDTQAKLIFITSSNDFAAESYSVRADYYLLKPYEEAEIRQVLERINLSDFESRRTLCLPNGASVLLSSVLYTSFSGHYVTIRRLNTPPLQVRCTQGAFEALILRYPDFVLCSKGVIVNLNEVDKLERDCFLLKDGSRVPISRRKYSEVKSAYSDTLIRNLRRR